MKRLAVALLAALGCAAFAPAGDPLRERPYVWAAAGQVELLTCRWSGDAPIGVALAADASPSEERVLDAALASLEGAGPGVRFLRVRGSGGASISVRFVDAAVARPDGTLGAARSVTDCRLGAAGARAALVAAEIEVARSTPPDGGGRTRALAPEALTDALFRELGHALGLASEPVTRASLAALYARPSGDVLARHAVEAWRTQEIDRLARLAATNQLDGPFLRAGDVDGRIFWRDAAGREWGFLVPHLAELARDPSALLLVPEAATRGALPRRPTP